MAFSHVSLPYTYRSSIIGKTIDSLCSQLRSLLPNQHTVLATKVEPDVYEAVREQLPGGGICPQEAIGLKVLSLFPAGSTVYEDELHLFKLLHRCLVQHTGADAQPAIGAVKQAA